MGQFLASELEALGAEVPSWDRKCGRSKSGEVEAVVGKRKQTSMGRRASSCCFGEERSS